MSTVVALLARRHMEGFTRKLEQYFTRYNGQIDYSYAETSEKSNRCKGGSFDEKSVNVSPILNSNRLKCYITHCGVAGWCYRCSVWRSAYVLFNERTLRQNFKVHNMMCTFMDKYLFPNH